MIGTFVVFFLFPKKDDEERLLAEYHSQDTSEHNGTVVFSNRRMSLKEA